MKTLLILAVILLTGCDCMNPKKCAEYKTVAEVGGCDKDGFCGIRYVDGSDDIVMFPAKGKQICIRKE